MTDPLPALITTHNTLIADLAEAECIAVSLSTATDGSFSTALLTWGQASKALHLWRESDDGKDYARLIVNKR